METRGQRLAEPGGRGFAVPFGRGFPEEHVLHLGASVQGAARVFSGRDGSGFGHRAPREQDGDGRGGREERGDQEDAHDRVCAEALPLLGQPTRIDQLARIAEPTEGEGEALVEAKSTEELRSGDSRNAMYEFARVVVVWSDRLGVLLHLVAPLLREAERERRCRGERDEEGEHFTAESGLPGALSSCVGHRV